MSNLVDVTKEQAIRQVSMERPHVVIVGAGASRAACPKGDRNGRLLPLMEDFIQVLNLGPLLDNTDIEYSDANFEDVYASLWAAPKCESIREQVEQAVEEYFGSVQIPDTPTIYDHLLLSLRGKDVVATFNWDPFLIQAYQRNGPRFRLPRMLFLHGNVMVGFCKKDRVVRNRGELCPRCGQPVTPSRLLYPITRKDYHQDWLISAYWREMEIHMRNAFMVTVFGYSAPQTDVSAIDLLKRGWGPPRVMEEFEIIDVKPENQLVKTWKHFIETHHYSVTDDFYRSWLARHPRRTGEAYINQFIDAAVIEDNPFPKAAEFKDLWSWFDRLQQAEREVEPTH